MICCDIYLITLFVQSFYIISKFFRPILRQNKQVFIIIQRMHFLIKTDIHKSQTT